jgi:hypothetical protein
MKIEDMVKLFGKMREIFYIGSTRRDYTSEQWEDLMWMWTDIFSGEDPERVWAGVRRYAHDGGRYWPYPAEVADAMPLCYPADPEDIDGMMYMTVGQARARDQLYDERRKLRAGG